jgi:thiosulfate reductase cytochrome b subunit
MSNDNIKAPNSGHSRWVKISHWIVTISFLALAFSGFLIVMSHPRFYWGEVGNELTPALFELPVSRNYRHGGFDKSVQFYDKANSPVSASRTYEIFNENGWGRSLHFLSAWFLVAAGLIYLLMGFFTKHFWFNVFPRKFSLTLFKQDLSDHLRMRIPPGSGGPHYGLLQKSTYVFVIFVLLPLAVVTGFTMSPAITAAYPFLLDLFGGSQSARTIHFFASVALVLFMLAHIVMIIKSGFIKQLRAMTFGK